MPQATLSHPPPLDGTPSWLPLLESADKGGLGPGKIPGEGWPSIETIDYVSKFIVLIVLLLALPWLIGKLVTSPHDVSRHSAGLAGYPPSVGE